MNVEVSDILFVLILRDGIRRGRCRPLVNAHGVCERARKEVVIADRELGQDLREGSLLLASEVDKGRDMSLVREDWERGEFSRTSPLYHKYSRMTSNGHIAHHGTRATQWSF